VPLQFHRLHHLVLGPRHGEQAAADPVDGLVVRGGRRHGRADRQPELARRADLQVVGGHLDRVRLVAGVAEPVRQVLGEGPAAGDVEDVHAAGDREERKIDVDRGPGHGKLESVAAVVRRVGLRVGCLVIQRGIDVPAAGQQQAVKPRDQAGHRGGRNGRQHHRRPAGPLNGSRVAHRRDNRLADPVAPASGLKLAGDADDRAAHPSLLRIRSQCHHGPSPPRQPARRENILRRPDPDLPEIGCDVPRPMQH